MSTEFEKKMEEHIDSCSLEQLRDILVNKNGDAKLTNRFRALFNLKCVAEEFAQRPEEAQRAVEYICEAFADSSELLKHEVAYVLGQTGNLACAATLREVMLDHAQQCMVRHEASEALGALGDAASLGALERSRREDPSEEVRQTSELAIERIRWQASGAAATEQLQQSLYSSVDPAPPLSLEKDYDVPQLQALLNDQRAPLFERYRAMFRLRDIGSDEACYALASGFDDPSALFKHEIAYVFGQIGNPCVVPHLQEVLKREHEAPMVRHEAAEALGSIATDDVLPVLKRHLQDKDEVVRESAAIALDMYDYENSNELEYAPA
ncbi:AFR426Cp [Eremothecium gossypii ATCC 10895]|uniref:Deoxyhypusine hydroxylase n=1 Tax=Eremothecium gossypii (strain ATCC 10895 / CBS 109.51 / FGSC 9923 / NRRL Y-1056) TaxID=284811 RepID=DOHH_EREGS|nr:AFR426Cp [Eremothecium gossypii ATCC 10895]Q752Z8.3 RecName: Full=Deoxyhypusine hydroxylase; Short=DOHH; AltName: Full=Deoxyhypusine dioxygenase; AltName: Full=Deoxyhypusine monooxygenase [Eremothecium gossypii ATCC 10895]AAS53797.2 AFR426Cp [Eremothecium gossypii ATCC 10895]AEY98109.1 FAFR426Cp [Eremothecium gossypii FDAG1]